jgi:OmpR-family two-component system manganese-sensing sensor histidine kinase
MFQEIRLRLTFWYVLVTGVLLLVFALLFFTYVRNTLIDRVDDTISHVAEIVERSIVHNSNKGEILFPLSSNLEEDHIDLEWFDKNRVLKWSTFSHAPQVPLDTTDRFITISPPMTEPLRQLTKPILINDELLGYLRISHPWFEVTQPVKELSLELLLGVVTIVLIVGIAGWWLSGLAMEPIQNSYQQLKQFTADVSHELRNPLAVIQTNTQVALLQSEPKPYLEVIERLTQRMGKLLEDLLFLARTDRNNITEKPKVCNLTEIIEDVLEEQQLIAMTKSIDLQIKGTDQKIEIKGYPEQLFCLFTNLIANGIKFTPQSGMVEISLTTIGNNIQIAVKDTGRGMADTTHIFDRYYRDQESDGSGLGLAIARAIVEQHRGKIKVESKVGMGTNFIVTLPSHG